MDISTPATGQTLDANISRIRVYSRSTMPTRNIASGKNRSPNSILGNLVASKNANLEHPSMRLHLDLQTASSPRHV
jgi:hypothetical protein